MYAYVMGPQTLPHSYWQFIVKSGPVSPVVLEAVRRNNRGLPVDVDAVNRRVARSRARVILFRMVDWVDVAWVACVWEAAHEWCDLLTSYITPG